MSKDETSINPRATLYFPRADILIELNSRRQEPKNSNFPSFLFSILRFTIYREMSDKENDMTDSQVL